MTHDSLECTQDIEKLLEGKKYRKQVYLNVHSGKPLRDALNFFLGKDALSQIVKKKKVVFSWVEKLYISNLSHVDILCTKTFEINSWS